MLYCFLYNLRERNLLFLYKLKIDSIVTNNKPNLNKRPSDNVDFISLSNFNTIQQFNSVGSSLINNIFRHENIWGGSNRRVSNIFKTTNIEIDKALKIIKYAEENNIDLPVRNSNTAVNGKPNAFDYFVIIGLLDREYYNDIQQNSIFFAIVGEIKNDALIYDLHVPKKLEGKLSIEMIDVKLDRVKINFDNVSREILYNLILQKLPKSLVNSIKKAKCENLYYS
jgi:hypothetical protein